MIKEYEYEGEHGWYKGHIEVTSEPIIEEGHPPRKVYNIASFFEDKPYGYPWQNISEVDLETIISTAERSLKKYLKQKGDTDPNNGVENKLKKLGFDTF